jgi:hypothetical protein
MTDPGPPTTALAPRIRNRVGIVALVLALIAASLFSVRGVLQVVRQLRG